MQESLKLMSYKQMIDTFGRRVFKEMRASFFCPRNLDVQNFIRSECSKYEKELKTKNYFFYDSENDRIAAFFTLSLHSIILGDLVSNVDESVMSVLRGYGKRDARSVGCYLIGQFARDDSYSSSDISGLDMFSETKILLKLARDIVGGRFVAIDCIKELIPFYEENGFVTVNQHADLFTMIMPITDL